MKKIANPRKIDDIKEMLSSLKMTLSFVSFGLDTSNTKNHDANMIPMIDRIVARCGYI